MSRTLATQSKSTSPRAWMLLWPEPPASHSASKEIAAAWMMRTVSWPSDSAKSLVALARDGWSGKTSPTCFDLTKDATLAASSVPWQNAGMGSHIEFWTLGISESPNDASVCLLSDIIETGDPPPECCLTDHNIDRLRSRLTKHNIAEGSELYRELCSAGPATKRQSTA